MRFFRALFLLLIAVLLAGCGDYKEIEQETGYKGKARLNPWLAAERLAQHYGHRVEPTLSWRSPRWDDATWVMPGVMLSNESFTRRMSRWVEEGGHLVLIMDHAEPANDWQDAPFTQIEVSPSLKELMESAGLDFHPGSRVSAASVDFRSGHYKVAAASMAGVSRKGEKAGAFASGRLGSGRLTVVMDGRMFRNRWISDHEHAALFHGLLETVRPTGTVVILRGTRLSFWGLLQRHLWPVLVALGVVPLLWLWKSFTRFGPVEPALPVAVPRGYDHHLEALGDFQWRLDKAAGLLAPIRAQIVEHGQRLSTSVGRRDDDFFQFLADRAELPRERVHRALVETAPADASILTRTTADLQKILHTLT